MNDKQNIKRSLILGGSCQLALTLVSCLLEKNIHPLITYRNLKGKERIRKELGAKAAMVELIHLDFCDLTSLLNLDACLKYKVDYMVDFAHSDYQSLMAGAKDDEIKNYFFINVSVRAMVLKRVARCMLTKRFGRLVFISSTAAKNPNPGQGFYAASKLAVEALYRNLGLEMASKGITTAILRPGFVDVGRGRRYLKSEDQTFRLLKKQGRIIATQDISKAVLFLLLTAGTSINGTVLTVDGGMTIGKVDK